MIPLIILALAWLATNALMALWLWRLFATAPEDPDETWSPEREAAWRGKLRS